MPRQATRECMANAIQETELKYEAPPGATLPDLRGLPHVASQSESDGVKLEATYHDTATYGLARAGITLRRRTGGSDAGWHLKVPRGHHTRTELRLPLGEELPREFADLLTARLRGQALRPVATITTRRRTCTLADEAGTPLAEIAVDTVTAQALGRSSSLTRWDEIEFELADGVEGGRDLLKAADRRLRHFGLKRAGHQMKLAVALADDLPETPSDATATRPGKSAGAGEVVLAYLRGRFEELLYLDLLVRRDEPDAIHRMRVAARRMRAALQEFRRLMPGAEAESVVGELRWLGQELGNARDEEVLCDLLVTQIGEVPAADRLGPVQARVAGHFAPRMAAAEANVRAVLASTRYLELLNSLEAFLAAPPFTAAAEEHATSVLPHLVRRSRRRVNRRMRTALDAATDGGERNSALHQARKAAKRARYAAEAVEPVVGKPARKSAKAFKKVQSTLGDQHDAVIAADALRGLAIRAYGAGENAFTYGLLHERLGERAASLAARAGDEWERAARLVDRSAVHVHVSRIHTR
jgi:CHAD domain-containing protein